MGVDWDDVAGGCGLRYQASYYGDASDYQYSAVRVNGPASGPVPSQIITSGSPSNAFEG
jgi:hypothetical protein